MALAKTPSAHSVTAHPKPTNPSDELNWHPRTATFVLAGVVLATICGFAAVLVAAANSGDDGADSTEPVASSPPGRPAGDGQQPSGSSSSAPHAGTAAPPANRPPRTGEAVYRAECVRCHGSKGQGTAEYSTALVGDRSVPQLTELIRKTMPEDKPNSLSQEESRAVSEYIHDAFYSRIAQERNRPPRIELARLTVRQYRQSLADLVGSFRGTPFWGADRGLRGEYYKSRRFAREDRVLERIDATVNLPLGTESPVPDKIDPVEFSMRWSGTLLAPDTGEYELILRTEHAARLWVNDNRTPVVDAWVKSGKDTEFRASVFLLAGRMYPVRVEYSKAKQGVNDTKNQKVKPKPQPTSIALLWRRPSRVAEVVPNRYLSPNGCPEQYVCDASFPPDDRSYGWERGTTISREWDAATTDAAIHAATYVVGKLNELAKTNDKDKDRAARVRSFAAQFAERAFRRPLTPEQTKSYIDEQFAAAQDNLELAVKRVVLLVLKSPRFLYREVGGAAGPYDVAARLSYGLWDTLPDQELWTAAARGQLATREQVAAQAERMLRDPRAQAKLREFLLTWAKADHGLDLAKDAKHFPGFDAEVIADLRTSLEVFLDEVLASPQADFRRLLLEPETYLNARLAKFYGVPIPSSPGNTSNTSSEWFRARLDAEHRAGLLSHPYLMTSFAHSKEGSPIHRGVFVARGILGIALRPPPEAVTPLSPDLHPTLTTRERVTMQTQPAACRTCHSVINPLGFPMEQFDAVGRFRERDSGKPIDASGWYRTRDGQEVKVTGVRELGRFLADSPETHAALVEQVFHHLVQQSVRAYGPATAEQLRKKLVDSGFSLRQLAVEVMAVSALTARPDPVGALKLPPPVSVAAPAPPTNPAPKTPAPPTNPAPKTPAPKTPAPKK